MGERTPPPPRETLLREFLEAREELDRLADELDRAGPSGAGDDAPYERAAARLAAAEAAYEAALPRPVLSRCPLTGELFRIAIDTAGLDGPWWDAERPVRPAGRRPDTFFALAGAIALPDPPPVTPFTVLPGPAVPWVCPRLLKLPGVRAVISTIEIGSSSAWPIVYYSDDPHPGVRRLDDWGAEEHVAAGPDGEPIVTSAPPRAEDYDFDLRPWLASGKLLWIEPGDGTFLLRSTVGGCPYLGIDGRREPVVLRRGRIRPFLSFPSTPPLEAR